MLSAALLAVTAQVPLIEVTDKVAPDTEQPVETPALYVTAPVPLPPLAVKVDVLPKVRLAGALTVKVAWLALVSVTVAAAELAAV